MASDPASIDPERVGIRLRPLGVADLLDETFRIYRRHFLAFLIAMAIMVIPTMLILQMVPSPPDPATTRAVTPSSVSEIVTSTLSSIIATLLRLLLTMTINGASDAAAGGAVTMLAASAILGRPLDLKEAYRQVLRRYTFLFWATIWRDLKVFLFCASIVGVVHGIRRSLGWHLIYQAIMVEDEDAPGSMRRSAALVNGHRLRLLAVTILLSLLALALVEGPEYLIRYGIRLLQEGGGARFWVMPTVDTTSTIVQAVSRTLFGGLTYIATTLFYFDLRVRKEAFDLELAAERLGTPAASTESFQEPAERAS